MDQKKKKSSTAAASANSTSVEPLQSTTGCLMHNYLIIWLDQHINEDTAIDKTVIESLRKIVNMVKTFANTEECIDFITNIKTEKVFLVSSGTLGQNTVPKIHRMAQVNGIYIFCGNRVKHEIWVREYSKVKGVFTNINDVYEALERSIREYNDSIISMSFMLTSSEAMNKSLDRLDQSFVYTQIVKEILLTINFGKEHLKEFTDYCQQQFVGNQTELKTIAKFEKDYCREKSIWWYTYSGFLSSLLNRALYTLEVHCITKLGFFIRDLHELITKMHTDQYAGRTYLDPFTVYRGQSLSETDFDSLMKATGGFLSFNSFLSTSKNSEASLNFARNAMETSDSMGILFVMKIHPSIPSTPFANISDVSYDTTDEKILFSMHSVFRIDQIKKINENNRLWEVILSLTNANDPQLHTLIEHIREETYPNVKGWYRLGDTLIKLNQFEKAQEVFQMMLTHTGRSEQAGIYYKLGTVKDKQNEYDEAISFHNKSIEIDKHILPPTHPDLCISYSCLGHMYEKVNKHSEALSSFQKALAIQQKILPPNHPDLATAYRNMGNVYDKMDKYTEALAFQEKAYEIYQKTLPPHHPDLATAHYKIGNTYYKMGDYTRAVSSFEKAVDIGQRSLAADDPSFQQWINDLESVKKKF